MVNPENTGEKISYHRLRELNAQFDKQLKEIAGAEKKSSARTFTARKIALTLFGLLVLLVLPFFMLIRTSVFLYATYQLNGWLALAAGAAASALILILYAAAANYLLNSSLSVHRYLRRALSVLVVVFCCYGLVYLSGLNAKTPEVESYYRSLHPIMRITVSTTILFYDDLVITDLQRTPADYEKMGLPVNGRSLHYPQKTGYVHALDLRTAGRPEWKNKVLEGALMLLGMKTLRHVGTADHLHVALPVPGE